MNILFRILKRTSDINKDNIIALIEVVHKHVYNTEISSIQPTKGTLHPDIPGPTLNTNLFLPQLIKFGLIRKIDL